MVGLLLLITFTLVLPVCSTMRLPFIDVPSSQEGMHSVIAQVAQHLLRDWVGCRHARAPARALQGHLPRLPTRLPAGRHALLAVRRQPILAAPVQRELRGGLLHLATLARLTSRNLHHTQCLRSSLQCIAATCLRARTRVQRSRQQAINLVETALEIRQCQTWQL